MSRTSISLAMLIALVLLGAPLPALADDTGSNWLDHDANGDGRLSRDEIDAARGGQGGPPQEPRQRRLDRLDTDSDGAISRDERAAVRDARHARHQEHRQRVLERYDADGDGRLSGDERRSAREARDARRAERGQRGGDASGCGPHGGGRGGQRH